MLAMHYRYVLPADYDMAIIQRRIADKASLLDGHAGLAFKAWLSADRRGGRLPTPHNAYAPFYLWHDAVALGRFLAGPVVAGLSESFGWPTIHQWTVWTARNTGALEEACCASIEHVPVQAWTDVAALHDTELRRAEDAAAQGALVSVVALDATRWSLVRMQLWAQWRPDLAGATRELFEVGHVSIGQAKLF